MNYSELLQLAKGWGNFKFYRGFIWRLPNIIPKTEQKGSRLVIYHVPGDSMAPYYSDGQIVWVERCTELNPGEVGIFICDNEGYIKQYSEVMPDENEIEDYTFNGIVYPKIYLVSFNKKYRPIFVSRTSRLEVIGRVLN